MCSQGAGFIPSHNPPVKMPPTTFLPHPWFYVFIQYILQETARLSVCAHQVQGSIFRNFCCLVVYLCRVVSLRSPITVTRWGLRGLLSPRIFMVLGGMKTAFVPSPSPGPWRAWRLDIANMDSGVLLTLTRTYIVFAVFFTVSIF